MKLNTIPNTKYYSGKVRDVYSYQDYIFIIASDRISAFDHILPKTIPFKGAVLNQISTFLLNETKHIVPNWLIESPCSHFSIGYNCPSIPIEVIVRGYLAGSMWRAYEKGERIFCGNLLPDGLLKNQKLPIPILTPTTKALEGHDLDTDESEILKSGVVTSPEWNLIKEYAFKIFNFGSEYADSRNLILVDTKFEFGRNSKNEIILIDEILTPDSSRYFLKNSYYDLFVKGEEPLQLSKEFVRQWLIEQEFMGREGDIMPNMSDEWIEEISEKYIELYNKLIGIKFVKESSSFNLENIQKCYDSFIIQKNIH